MPKKICFKKFKNYKPRYRLGGTPEKNQVFCQWFNTQKRIAWQDSSWWWGFRIYIYIYIYMLVLSKFRVRLYDHPKIVDRTKKWPKSTIFDPRGGGGIDQHIVWSRSTRESNLIFEVADRMAVSVCRYNSSFLSYWVPKRKSVIFEIDPESSGIGKIAKLLNKSFSESSTCTLLEKFPLKNIAFQNFPEIQVWDLKIKILKINIFERKHFQRDKWTILRNFCSATLWFLLSLSSQGQFQKFPILASGPNNSKTKNRSDKRTPPFDRRPQN